ncbi:hypothetical protein BV210_15695 [Halorientalis sp. IM1011]|uniref:DUF7322 domain-containing protein n=1 Tax=Halorientalis sp. IM1011 TaxID=1932360 RepID=UPI00097CCB59|nr:hypothetical protein [Halorientalis sp. IM1011]AQL44055.1 hypothetical protein BV210_15695 [Halorientalis sp. IM1011]
MFDPFGVIEEEDFTEPPEGLEDSISRADAATFWGFIAAALLAQAGLFAASLGLMYGGFRGQWTLGVPLVAGGLVAMGLATGIVIWHRRR